MGEGAEGPSTARDRLWRWALAAGLLAAGLQLGLRGSGVATAVLHLAVQALVVVCAVAGLRMYRPSGRTAWYLLLAGMVVYLGANAIRYPANARGVVLPSFTDALYLSAYLLLVGGMMLILRARKGGPDRGGFLEVLAMAAGVSALVWAVLIDPYAHDADLSGFAKTAAISYPLMGLLFLAVVARIAFLPGRKPVALWLLGGFLLAQLAAGSVYGVQQLAGTYSFGSEVDALWLASFAFFGAAVLHPSMRTLAAPAHGPAPRAGLRMATLGGAALLGSVALLAHGPEGDFPVLVVIVTGVFVAVLARMRLLSRGPRYAPQDRGGPPRKRGAVPAPVGCGLRGHRRDGGWKDRRGEPGVRRHVRTGDRGGSGSGSG